jgi:uncharacterized protein YbaA (DUF1428 family)
MIPYDDRGKGIVWTIPDCPRIVPIAPETVQIPGETPMTYIDGFVLAVPTANKEAFRKMAEDAAVIFKDHGALQIFECWGDDVPDGKVTSFPMAVKCKPDETVVFSWVVWASREARDKGNDAVMADPRLGAGMEKPPFDGKRMIFGGFQPIVEA